MWILYVPVATIDSFPFWGRCRFWPEVSEETTATAATNAAALFSSVRTFVRLLDIFSNLLDVLIQNSQVKLAHFATFGVDVYVVLRNFRKAWSPSCYTLEIVTIWNKSSQILGPTGKNIIDLPGGGKSMTPRRKHHFLWFLPATPSSPSQTLDSSLPSWVQRSRTPSKIIEANLDCAWYFQNIIVFAHLFSIFQILLFRPPSPGFQCLSLCLNLTNCCRGAR